jgi:CBS domain-containing protein
MTVGELCNREVAVATEDTSLQAAADLMRQHHVGNLIVVEEVGAKRVPRGIVTDRDIVIEVVAKGLALDAVTVGDIMSFELLSVTEESDVLETIKLMRAKGVRRTPVVDGSGALTGILAVDDIIELLAEVQVDLMRLVLREQEREQETRP